MNDTSKMCAFLWDESFLWGLMAYKALKGLGLPFDLIRAGDIKSGVLGDYRMLFVPGGWASNKSRTLEAGGIKAIREFVENGGSYLGFCGGAGLATKAKGGIGLLDVTRMPTRQRVPSFSGRIRLNVNTHPIWKGLSEHCSCVLSLPGVERDAPEFLSPDSAHIFHAWWPSQFIIEDSEIEVLATYGDAMPDAFSSDLNVESVMTGGGWGEFEDTYKINLNPERLTNEPAVLEGRYGGGKVVLSLIHFDTPGDMNGKRALVNLWRYLTDEYTEQGARDAARGARNTDKARDAGDPVCERRDVPLLCKLCADLISLGERNFLWFWRNPMLLQWRRGIRGLEYNTIYILMKEIDEILRTRNTEHMARNIDRGLDDIRPLLIPFIVKAKRLLIRERHALQKGFITYDKCDDPEIKQIRTELFADSKSYGGMFKDLIDRIDRVLFDLLDNNEQ